MLLIQSCPLTEQQCLCLAPILHSAHLALHNSVMVLYHKEFEQAGKRTGLQIWRIERMELAPVPESLHGSFYVGDAYLVLRTVKQKDVCFYDLHFWLGKLKKNYNKHKAQ